MHPISTRIISLITLSLLVFSSTNIIFLGNLSIETVSAYTESDANTFAYYQRILQGSMEELESEFRINSTVSTSTLQNIKNLVQSAYDRLPDSSDVATENASAKRGTDLAIDLAMKNPSTQTHVSNAVTAIQKFITSSKIGKITGSISANPSSGNAPLTVSFLATNVSDPSGVSPTASNYVWWIREDGGYRREIGRGASLTYTFNQEGSYQVFLDVISGSRNKKGYTDVLPLSISQNIQVKPRLGEITLLVNGVNVSTLSKLKVNPSVGKIGIILDATASRAVSNGTILRTKWDFGNGNTIEYNGSPVIERQIYANEGTYTVSLELTTNEGTSFRKEIQLNIVDPAAVISSDKNIGFVGENFQMKAQTYFSNTKNVDYTWTVQSVDSTNSSPLYTQEWQAFSYKFPQVGDYIVTLMTKNPNGSEDRDSKTITIESHEPIVNLDAPRPVSSERPNTILFDASKSMDADTNTSKDLTYKWSIDGNLIALDNSEKNGAIGTHVFSEKGTHTVSLTVANKYGKVKTVDKTFDVASTLAVNVNIVPRAAPIGTLVSFQAIAPRAAFFEWNPGDGSAPVNGQMDNIDHIYKKTGIYSATLTVKNVDGSETNSITRKVYVTDASTPFALIDVKNASNSVIEDENACGAGGAYLVNRSEWTTLDGSNSINIDGNNTGLSYTWKYLDRVKTGPTLSEKFTELGCFPVTLTVKSATNGASYTSKRYIQIKNIVPKLTSISTNIDQNKQSSQKVIVNVTADGASDPDGVITTYIWYYKTASDDEPQNIKITQSPTTTFVLPNVTEKYTFWVILEDNDGAQTNSIDVIKDQAPLLISNEDGNLSMPLITLTIPKSQVLAGESVDFVASAKTIVWMDITSKSEYQWDFDGDGKIDKKTTEARTNYTYKNAGTYTAKVKVTYNGVSNSKYQTIIVKNELKAKVIGYRSDDAVYLINTSAGVYDTTSWQVGEIRSDALYSISVPTDIFNAGNQSSKILTVSANGNESSSVEITLSAIQDINNTLSGGIYLQSYPVIENDTIHVASRGENVLLSLYGNAGTNYAIDTNTNIDSDTNGTPNDDIDNKDFPSYIDGSVFVFDSTNMKTHSQKMKLSVLKNGTIIGSREVEIIADFIADTSDSTTRDISGTGSEGFSQKDKNNLENLQAKIRNLESDDRIILTQEYNSLIENWDDELERTKNLIGIQEEVESSAGMTDSQKKEFATLIDTILVGDATATDEVTVATKVIESLIPADNPNKTIITEKLEAIKSHPGNLTENKTLGTAILELIKDDTSIEDKYKLIIRSQLQIIVNGGQESVPTNEITTTDSGSSGIMGFIVGIVKVFGFIMLIILVIVLVGFIFYRVTKKKDDIGFQDFLIDSIFHSRNREKIVTTGITQNQNKAEIKEFSVEVDPLSAIKPEETKVSEKVDPMASFSQDVPSIATTTSPEWENNLWTPLLPEEQANIPDWLKPQDSANTLPETTTLAESSETKSQSEEPIEIDPLPTEVDPLSMENGSVPDWLKTPSETLSETIPEAPETPENSETTPENSETPNIPEESSDSEIPTSDENILSEETLTPDGETEKNRAQEKKEDVSETPLTTNTTPWETLPDWLIDSVSNSEPEKKLDEKPEKSKQPPQKQKKPKEKSEKKNEVTKETPNTTPNTDASDLPDWLK